MTIGLSHYLAVAAILFTIGVLGIFINRKNVIVILMSVELILLAVNINFVAFSTHLGRRRRPGLHAARADGRGGGSRDRPRHPRRLLQQPRLHRRRRHQRDEGLRRVHRDRLPAAPRLPHRSHRRHAVSPPVAAGRGRDIPCGRRSWRPIAPRSRAPSRAPCRERSRPRLGDRARPMTSTMRPSRRRIPSRRCASARSSRRRFLGISCLLSWVAFVQVGFNGNAFHAPVMEWIHVGAARGELGVPHRHADGGHARRRHDRLLPRPPLLDRLHGGGSGPAPLLRLSVALHLRHAHAGDGRQPRPDVLRLGGRRSRELSPHRLLVSRSRRPMRRPSRPSSSTASAISASRSASSPCS